jgi:hypothetical protein
MRVRHPGIRADFCPNCGARTWSSGGVREINTRYCASGTVSPLNREAVRFPGGCGTSWVVTPAQLAQEQVERGRAVSTNRNLDRAEEIRGPFRAFDLNTAREARDRNRR